MQKSPSVVWIFRLVVSACVVLGSVGATAQLLWLEAFSRIEVAELNRDAQEMGVSIGAATQTAASATVVVEEVTDIVAGLLALALVWLGSGSSGALWLGMFLAWWGIGPFELELLGFAQPLPSWLNSLMLGIGIVPLVAFVTVFPTPLPRVNLPFRRVWPAVSAELLTLCVGAVLIASVELAPRPLDLVPLLLIAAGAPIAMVIFLIRTRTSPESDRAGLLWLASGLSVLALGLALIGGIYLPAFIFQSPMFGSLTPLVIAVLEQFLSVLFMALMAVAVLYKGAIDPGLVLYRTIMAGVGVVTVVFAYAAIESLVTDRVAVMMGFPGPVGSALAGGLTALTLMPFRSSLRPLARSLGSRVFGLEDRAGSVGEGTV